MQVLPKAHTPELQVPTWFSVPAVKVAVLQETLLLQILQVWLAEEQKLDIWHRVLSPVAGLEPATAQLAVYWHWFGYSPPHVPTWLTSSEAKSLVWVQVSF